MNNKSLCAFGEVLFDDYEDYKKIGGAPFNYTYHLNKLSYDTRLISRIGNDMDGAEIILNLKRNSIPHEFVQVDEHHKTGLVVVKLNDDKVPDFRILQDRAYDNIELKANVLNHVINETSMLYFGTLAQRASTSRNTLNSLLNRNLKYFFDVNIRQDYYTKEILINSLTAANVVKMNVDELRILNVLLYNGERLELNDSAHKLLSDYNLDLLSITLGADGSTLLSKDNSVTYQKEAENVVNTVGAGDAFSAMLTIGYLSGWNLDKTIKTASEFAADICGIEGAVLEDDSFYNKYKNIINE